MQQPLYIADLILQGVGLSALLNCMRASTLAIWRRAGTPQPDATCIA